MSMKDARARAEEALAKVAANPGTRPLSPSGRPLTSPGAMAMMQPAIDALNERTKAAEGAAQAAKIEIRRLRSKMENNPVDLPFDQIIEAPGRRRRLPPQEFEALRQNLENNPLVHPLAVRLLPDRKTVDGRQMYELISGYSRLDVLRVLDRKVAPVRVLSVDNVEADDAAFWSNLFQHSLSDFEKYLGLKKVQARHGLGEAQLAKHAGVSKTLLSFLFSYEALPQPVLDFLRDQPHILDANAAGAIGIVVKSGGTERVVEAMRELAAGRISQGEAVAQAQQERSSAPPSSEGR